jgi:transcriptional regulator with XRE-family HTH domain
VGLGRRESAALPARLAALKESLGVKNQIDFAAALGTDQGTVSRWLNGKSRPLPETLIEMANLAEGADKLFFLEEAGLAPEFFEGSPMLREMREATTKVVAKTLRSPPARPLTFGTIFWAVFLALCVYGLLSGLIVFISKT